MGTPPTPEPAFAGSPTPTVGMAAPADPRNESMGELLRDLTTDMSTLVRQELALAQVEMTEKGKRAGVGAGMLGGAGLFGLVTLAALAATVTALLATTMKVWLAALIVTVIYGAVTAALALIGKNAVSAALPPAPEQTTETLKEDAQWAKTQLSSDRK